MVIETNFTQNEITSECLDETKYIWLSCGTFSYVDVIVDVNVDVNVNDYSNLHVGIDIQVL